MRHIYSLMIKESFFNIMENYTNDIKQINLFWSEIELNYSEEKRFYHNLNHLNYMLTLLFNLKRKILDWDTIFFSIIYHDIIYNVSSKINEELSAEFAVERLKMIRYPLEKIEKCKSQILATRGHSDFLDSDSNYLMDADLGILGESWELYNDYKKKIRKEYYIYSDSEFRSGRKKFIKYFSNLKRIYKSNIFYEKFEYIAKENLKKEIEEL